jgi:hypothetical protein
MRANDQRDAFSLLASLPDRLPAGVRARLGAVARSAVAKPPADRRFAGDHDALGPATELLIALGGFDDDELAGWLTDLSQGKSDHRQSAARIASGLARAEDTGVW